jgi:hypothetical protein
MGRAGIRTVAIRRFASRLVLAGGAGEGLAVVEGALDGCRGRNKRFVVGALPSGSRVLEGVQAGFAEHVYLHVQAALSTHEPRTLRIVVVKEVVRVGIEVDWPISSIRTFPFPKLELAEEPRLRRANADARVHELDL